MLKKLRSLSPESKKKIVLVCAGTLTFFVFVFWAFNFFGIFLNTVSDTATKGASVYSAFEQNIEKVYNKMNSMIPKGILDNKNTEISPEPPATTTDIMYDNK